MLRPLHDRVIIRLDTPEEKTSGGLYIPAVAQERRNEGTVIAVGPGRYQNGVLVPMQLQVGDRVVFGKYGGHNVLDDKTTLIFREEEILAVRD